MNHATFKADCHECGGHLQGYLRLKPGKSHDALFDCKLEDAPPNYFHRKRRHRRGNLRSQVATELLESKKTAKECRLEHASALHLNEGMDPNIPNAAVLRKAKQEALDKCLDLKTSDPIQNLLQAKFSMHPRTIKNIGLHLFFCHYWSDEQELLYKSACKEDKSCTLIIDVSGSFALPVVLPNGKKSPHIMMFCCICQTEAYTFPAFHMVSAKQDAQAITDFLAQIRKRVPAPRMTVSDFSMAILIAIARVFANCVDFQDYLKRCYQIIMSIGNPVLPSCFIRMDVSHFVKMICNWPCVKNSLEKVREFTVKSLCYVYKCDNFEVVEKTMKALLLVLLSKEIGVETNTQKKLKSQKCLEKMDTLSQGVIFEEPESTCIENIEVDDGNNSEVGDQKGIEYDIEGIEFYGEENSRYLPFWTGVMRPYFERGEIITTSAAVESEFSYLKTTTFPPRMRPLRVDKLILLHIRYLFQRVRLAAAESKQEKVEKIKGSERQVVPAETTNVDEGINGAGAALAQLESETAGAQEISYVTEVSTTNMLLNFAGDSELVSCEIFRIKCSTPLEVSIDDVISSRNVEDERNSLNEKENWRGKGDEHQKFSRQYCYMACNF